MATVLVTGATGFIGSHVCRQLLESGDAVRAGVRDPDAPKCDVLRGDRPLGVEGGSVELVRLDLEDDRGWSEAMQGCDGVIHVASPVPIGIAYKEDYAIIPTAVNGTRRCLRAAAAARVPRVVLTSSIAAILFPNGRSSDPSDDTAPPLTEADWTDAEGTEREIGAYHASKTLAERWAWSFVEDLPSGQSLELVSINPAVVIGPVLSRHCYSSSRMVREFIIGRAWALPRCPFPMHFVDVRDVARAHVEALRRPEANGNRYILHHETLDLGDIVDALADEFVAQGFPWPRRRVPIWFVRALSWFSSDIRLFLWLLGSGDGRTRPLDGSKAARELGIDYRPTLQSFRDAVHSFVAVGAVPAPTNYAPPAPG